MCDTMIKIQEKGVIFGKNSDRSPNEPNLTLFYPAQTPKDRKQKCTYITVEQPKKTHPVLLVSPSWMWGAEMGINDRGVIIGNEAVFTHSKDKKTERLTGMDILRLALETADDAKMAKDVILQLQDKYGQGGNCGFDKPFYYDNSFLIADKNEAFILETSGKEWIIKPVVNQGNISNRLSISDSPLVSNQPEDGFSHHHTEPVFTYFSGSLTRQNQAKSHLESTGTFDVSAMMQILQSHREQDLPHLFRKGSVQSVCMHKSFLGDHTTGSMIVESRKTIDTIWITGCSTPCLSLYKPVYFGVTVPPVFINRQACLEYWLEREYLVRAIFAGLIDQKAYQTQLNSLQKNFIEGDRQLFLSSPTPAQLQEYALKCSRAEQAFIDQYQNEITSVQAGKAKMSPLWKKLNFRLGKDVFSPLLATRKGK